MSICVVCGSDCSSLHVSGYSPMARMVSLAGIEPAAPDLGGLGLSFSRDVNRVHATIDAVTLPIKGEQAGGL